MNIAKDNLYQAVHQHNNISKKEFDVMFNDFNIMVDDIVDHGSGHNVESIFEFTFGLRLADYEVV